MRASLVGAVAALLLFAGSATAATRPCPPRSGTIVATKLGRVWHAGTSLYACSNWLDGPSSTRRLGPWKPGAHVVFNGMAVAWTVPFERDGVRSDRLWSASPYLPQRWLPGRPLVPATREAPAGENLDEDAVGPLLPEREGRIAKLTISSRHPGWAVGWVTTEGAVGFAVRASDDDLLEPRGALKRPLYAASHRTLLGEFGAAAVPELVRSIVTSTGGNGEADDCAGSTYWLVDFKLNGKRMGASWLGHWSTLRGCG